MATIENKIIKKLKEEGNVSKLDNPCPINKSIFYKIKEYYGKYFSGKQEEKVSYF
ncbi:MAG: hypothetical protein KC516_00020 [Nanoarchaeota archaeon]|nr:hypothetical protein [Nanoarchaeota archaeon]